MADTRNKSQEETGKTNILVSQLSKEAKDLGDRIFGTPEDDYDFGMTLNLIEEVTELRKRFVEI